MRNLKEYFIERKIEKKLEKIIKKETGANIEIKLNDFYYGTASKSLTGNVTIYANLSDETIEKLGLE